MTTRDYPRLPIEQFGRLTIESGDLDPVYGALVALWPEPRDLDKDAALARWLVAYLLCYHCGLSSWLSDQPEPLFWDFLLRAARNEDDCPVGGRWPRSPERRHWRGANAVRSTVALIDRYPQAINMIDYIAGGDDGPSDPEPYEAVRARAAEHDGWGPWASFKTADLIDRVWGVSVSMTDDNAMYEEPIKGALMAWRQKTGVPAGSRVKDEARAVRQVMHFLDAQLSDLPAPGRPGRDVGFAERETVACKWRSHMNGHYPLGHDLREIRRGVESWAAVSPTAAAFLSALPPVPAH